MLLIISIIVWEFVMVLDVIRFKGYSLKSVLFLKGLSFIIFFIKFKIIVCSKEEKLY